MFKAYWKDSKDVSRLDVLQQIVDECGVKLSVKNICADEELKKRLLQNTQEVVGRGGFGVPDFWVPSVNRLFYGADRLHFVEFHLGNKNAQQPRVQKQIIQKQKPTLTFYYDFSSPWAYIASTQIERVAREGNANLEYVPILLGALFREYVTRYSIEICMTDLQYYNRISNTNLYYHLPRYTHPQLRLLTYIRIGTPNMPMLAVGEQKRAWGAADMKDWLTWWNIPMNWPSTFPIRTVYPLRVAIVEPKVIPCLCKYCIDISNI
jgi:2-hydroxychromene-2-carboxylate isomerase